MKLIVFLCWPSFRCTLPNTILLKFIVNNVVKYPEVLIVISLKPVLFFHEYLLFMCFSKWANPIKQRKYLFQENVFVLAVSSDWSFLGHFTGIFSNEVPLTKLTWWRHQMEDFSALLAICAGNSLVTGEFPAQRPVTRSFDVFFDLHLNKWLSKHSWGWLFVTPHYYVTVVIKILFLI